MENIIFYFLIVIGFLIIILTIISIILNKKTKVNKNVDILLDSKEREESLERTEKSINSSPNSTKLDSMFTTMLKSLVTFLEVCLFWFVISISLYIVLFILLSFLHSLDYYNILPSFVYGAQNLIKFIMSLSGIGFIYTLIRIRDQKIKYED